MIFSILTVVRCFFSSTFLSAITQSLIVKNLLSAI